MCASGQRPGAQLKIDMANFKLSFWELEICLYLSYFSKEVSQLTDCQTYKKFVIIWQKCTNISGMSPKKFRNIYHPGQEISQFLPTISKEDWQTNKKFIIIGNLCTNISGMSPKNFSKMSHPELEIPPYLSNISKEVSQLPDWQTYKKFRIIWI